MPDETETIEQDLEPAADPGASTTSEASAPPASPAPVEPDELTLLRERVARLEGENAVLKTRPEPAAPAKTEPAQPPLTPQVIEDAYAKGEVTDAQRIQLHAQLVAGKMRETERAEDAKAAPLRTATDDLGAYIAAHPALNERGSDLNQQVSTQVYTLARKYGWDAADPRVQLMAVKLVLGDTPGGDPVATKTTESGKEFARRRIPTGGGGGPAGGGATTTKPKTQGEKLWAAFTDAAKEDLLSMSRTMERAIKTLNHAGPDSIENFRKRGRFKPGAVV